jgi:indolepyruvate decarboxylase
MTVTIAEYLLARLAELGVRHMFGVPGDFNLWFLEQTLQTSQIDFVGCCNELNAGYAADGCSRLAGISALATTYGVGELAALSAVAGAYAERVPIVCITGAPPLAAIRTRALLHHTMANGNYDDMLTCYRQFTVAQARIEPVNAREEIDRVLRTCWLEKRPVYLQLPSDIAGVRTEPPAAALNLQRPLSDPQQLAYVVSRISELLSCSSAPAILVDADSDRFALTKAVVHLAERNSIPIAHLIPARGVIDDNHDLSIGMYSGSASSPSVSEVIENSDCLICVGTRFTDVATGIFTHQLDRKSVIDIQSFSVEIDGEAMTGVDAAEMLSALASGPSCRSRRIKTSSNSELPVPNVQAGRALGQTIFWSHVQNYLQPGDIVAADAGTALFAGARLRLLAGATFIAQPIWASIGYGLPALLGAGLAAPERRQLLFIGDGAFQMTVQELSTILRLDLKPIIFLLNNDGYTIERLIHGAESIYNDIHPWRYGQIPKAFDCANRAATHLD